MLANVQLEGAKFEAAQQLSLRDGYVIPNATKTSSALRDWLSQALCHLARLDSRWAHPGLHAT